MKQVKIGQVFSTIRNGATIQQDKVVDGIPITRIETIADGTVDMNRLGYASVQGENFKDFYLEEGDILMSHINSVSHLGKVAIFENRNEKIIHGMNLLCLKTYPDKLLPKYAFYYLKSLQFRSSIKKITKKSVNQASFNISNLKEIDIPLPSLSTQIQIANILSKAETLIEQRKQSIALLDEFLKSTFLKMFGDPTSNKKKYPKAKIRDVVTEVKYGTSKPAEEEGKYPYLRMNNITTDGYWDLSKLKYINMGDDEKAKCVVRKGDLLFNRTNSKELVGKTAVFNLDEEMIIAGYLIRLRFKENINPYFVWGYLNSLHGKQTLLGMCKSIVGMANINAQELQDLKIIIPPIKLQTQFAAIVTKTEALKEQYKKSLQELENLYGSLSQQAFKGALTFKEEEEAPLMMAAEPDVKYN